MGLDFLHQYGGRRLRSYPPPPLADPPDGVGDDEKPAVDLDIELSPDQWSPRDVGDGPPDPTVLPRRFIDGCHSGEIIAVLRAPGDYLIPVRLAEIGGICIRAEGSALRREFAVVQRVVSLILDPFPWEEVEEFAAGLIEVGIRLVPALPPKDKDGRRGLTRRFEQMREQPRAAVQRAMRVLEELALGQDDETPSLIDGRLGGRIGGKRSPSNDTVGVIKSHREDYLHDQGWQTFYRLEPGQRTPAFKIRSKHLPVASWYLKLDGSHGAMPDWGVVRVEVPWEQFERRGCDKRYFTELSRALLHLRCRQASYGRAPVSLEPIVRAEESLKSLFCSLSTLQQHFFRLTRL